MRATQGMVNKHFGYFGLVIRSKITFVQALARCQTELLDSVAREKSYFTLWAVQPSLNIQLWPEFLFVVSMKRRLKIKSVCLDVVFQLVTELY